MELEWFRRQARWLTEAWEADTQLLKRSKRLREALTKTLKTETEIEAGGVRGFKL